MNILGIIPARYNATRLAGKPLVMIMGKPMIQRVYEQCKKAAKLSDCIVATDDERIFNVIKNIGGKVMMTATTHLNGTARCAEVATRQAEFSTINFDYIINIQGDEPLINPKQIDELAILFDTENIDIVTQVKVENNLALLNNKNIVKAILDEQDFALQFNRIINDKKILNQIEHVGAFYRHIGIYGFKNKVLQEIAKLPPSKNEIEHHLEQLRWLDNSFKIKVGMTNFESISVDTKEDAEKVIQAINKEMLIGITKNIF